MIENNSRPLGKKIPLSQIENGSKIEKTIKSVDNVTSTQKILNTKVEDINDKLNNIILDNNSKLDDINNSLNNFKPTTDTTFIDFKEKITNLNNNSFTLKYIPKSTKDFYVEINSLVYNSENFVFSTDKRTVVWANSNEFDLDDDDTIIAVYDISYDENDITDIKKFIAENY